MTAIMRRPTTRSFATTAPAVYTADGAMDYVLDSRLHVESIKLFTGKEGGTATLRVQLDDDFDAKAAIELFTRIDGYVLIDTGEDAIEKVSFLFNGRIVKPTLSIGGSGTETSETVTLECEHISKDLKNIWVFGRIIEWKINSGRWNVVPPRTIFNYKGYANRAKNTITRTVQDGQIACPLFSSLREGMDSSARQWNYAEIFLYLIGWYGSTEFSDFTLVDFSGFAATCTGYQNLDPGGTGLEYMLRQRAVELNIDGLNLLDALDKTAQAAGISYAYRCKYIQDADSRDMDLKVEFSAWAPGSGEEKYLQLEEKQTDIINDGWGDEDAETTLKKNNVKSLNVTYDASEVITSVTVNGSPYRYEFTATLVPGWAMDGVLDNPSDVAAAKSEASKHWDLSGTDLENDSWYQKYHAGSEQAGSSLNYGRHWVLNEDGAFTSRNSFDIGSYLGLSQTAQQYTAIWPRYFLPCLTCDLQGRSLGIVVEISYDSGGSWHVLNSGVRNINDRCGVWLAISDLTMLMPPGIDDPNTQNAWFALLDGTFQLRVTASVELDLRLQASWHYTSAKARCLYVEQEDLRVWSRSNKSKYADAGYAGLPVQLYNDEQKAKDVAAAILNATAQWQIPANIIIPWLETGYVLGDRIPKIEGRDISLVKTIGARSSSPEIKAIIWRAGSSYSTELVLGDTRLASEIV